jgi:hypothetical protein
MAWPNFAHLTKPLVVQDIKIQGPGKLVLASAVSGTTEKLTPHRMETQAGGPAEPPNADAVAFAKRQTLAVRPIRSDDKVRTRPWFNVAMTQSKENLDTFVQMAVDQLRKGINAQSLAEAQAVFNELSKTPEGAAAVRRQVNPQSLAQAIKLSKGRA